MNFKLDKEQVQGIAGSIAFGNHCGIREKESVIIIPILTNYKKKVDSIKL